MFSKIKKVESKLMNLAKTIGKIEMHMEVVQYIIEFLCQDSKLLKDVRYFQAILLQDSLKIMEKKMQYQELLEFL